MRWFRGCHSTVRSARFLKCQAQGDYAWTNIVMGGSGQGGSAGRTLVVERVFPTPTPHHDTQPHPNPEPATEAVVE